MEHFDVGSTFLVLWLSMGQQIQKWIAMSFRQKVTQKSPRNPKISTQDPAMSKCGYPAKWCGYGSRHMEPPDKNKPTIAGKWEAHPPYIYKDVTFWFWSRMPLRFCGCLQEPSPSRRWRLPTRISRKHHCCLAVWPLRKSEMSLIVCKHINKWTYVCR